MSEGWFGAFLQWPPLALAVLVFMVIVTGTLLLKQSRPAPTAGAIPTITFKIDPTGLVTRKLDRLDDLIKTMIAGRSSSDPLPAQLRLLWKIGTDLLLSVPIADHPTLIDNHRSRLNAWEAVVADTAGVPNTNAERDALATFKTLGP